MIINLTLMNKHNMKNNHYVYQYYLINLVLNVLKGLEIENLYQM